MKAQAKAKVSKKRAKAKRVVSAPRPHLKLRKPVAIRPGKKKTVGRTRKLTAKQQAELHKMLMSLRERLTGQVSALKDASLHPAEPLVSGEDGTDVYERQFNLLLASSESEAISEIDDALRRIKNSGYGVCETCGAKVGLLRLKALPFVRLCIDCQADLEGNRGGRRRI